MTNSNSCIGNTTCNRWETGSISTKATATTTPISEQDNSSAALTTSSGTTRRNNKTPAQVSSSEENKNSQNMYSTTTNNNRRGSRSSTAAEPPRVIAITSSHDTSTTSNRTGGDNNSDGLMMNAGSNHSLEFATLLASPATEFQNGTTTRPAATTRGTKNNRGSFSNISFASIAESGEDETETDAPDAQECDHGSCSVVRDEVEEPDEECSLAGEEDYEPQARPVATRHPRPIMAREAPRQAPEQEHHDEFPRRNDEDATGYTAAFGEMRQAVEQQICHALQHVTNVSMRQRRSASSAQVSSDYWKGLLVGMFLVQAIFVPVWAAWAAGGGGGADSGIVFAFLQGSIWKLIVLIVSGVGFVVVALIAIQYDCALQDELQELRRLAATATAGSGTDSGDGAHTRTTGTRRHASGSRTGSRTSSTTVTPIASNPPAEQSTSGRALSERLTTRSTTRRVATQPQQETPPRSVPPAATVRWAAEGAAGQASVASDPSSQRRRRRQQEQQPQRRQEQQPQRRQEQQPQQPRREEEPRSQRPQSQQNNSVVAQAVPVAPGENNSVSETVPSTASVHEEDQEPTEVVATPTRNNHEDVVRFEEEEKEPERDDYGGFDNHDKQEGDRPPSGMVVTSSHTIMPTQTTTSTSRHMSFNNRSMTMSLSSHTSQNMDHPTPASGGARDDDSLTAPTKEITCAQSTSQPSSFAPQSTPDFYPDATVLFAHISGFTAWSSERGPEQIFLLLEKLHRRFDDAARRLEITKVETTSESYQAVTGVPHEQPDHAVRMIKFAKQIMQSMVNIVDGLEGTLGPDTGLLRLRIGVHSGSLTAGILGGRFQLLGKTVGIAQRMETTSHRHRIQISEGTAELLRKAEKEDWIQKREECVTKTDDGRDIQTYFVVITSPLTGRGASMYHGQKSTMSMRSGRSGKGSNTGAAAAAASALLAADNAPKRPTRRQVWDEAENDFMMSLPPMSRAAKNKRLVSWVNKLLTEQLLKIMVQRGTNAPSDFDITEEVLGRVAHGAVPSEEFVNVIRPAGTLEAEERDTITDEPSSANLPAKATQQLRALVTKIAALYDEKNPYHSFDHAAHTTMSAQKLLNRCFVQDDDDDWGPEASMASKSFTSTKSASRQYMNCIASDALSQFAVIFAACVHDCGHRGLSSRQLTRLNPKLSEKYNHESVQEQNSIDLSWSLLVDPEYAELQKCLFSNESELKRFRELLVNCLLATDLNNGRSQALRHKRWDRAFHMECDSSTLQQEEDADLKATAVVECLVQASDISHAMQHWKVHQKWNERLYREKFISYEAGKSFCNPLETWYQEELSFFDKHVIPLAKRLAESGVFGVASNECLNHALENRKEWESTGEQLVKDMYDRYCKRKEMEIGGFTNEEINNFTPKELEYIMKKLVEKGRNRGTNEVDEEKGQNDAAQAWLDALEIYERCPAAMEIADRSIVFPIYSGIVAWIKLGKIPQDQNGHFELNLAQKFVQESKLHLDPIHHTRALSMLSEAYGRRGNYTGALAEFKKLAEIYSFEAHSAAIAGVYGTDRSAQAFSLSALWHEQLGNSEEAVAVCEYVIQDLLPLMDPTNTLGNFELLLIVIAVLKPRGQEKHMLQLLKDYVITPFRKHHGPNGFTPCMCCFKPLVWLLDICADPARFRDLDEAAEWLLENDDSGVMDEFVDSVYTGLCWSMHDLVAELCLRIANRLALEDRDIDQQRALVRKGMRLTRRADRKIKDGNGNVVLQVANARHEPVFNALELVAKQMGVEYSEENESVVKVKQLNVNLPPSYLRPPADR